MSEFWGKFLKKSGFPGESLLLFCHSAGCLVRVGSWELDDHIPLQNMTCLEVKHHLPILLTISQFTFFFL